MRQEFLTWLYSILRFLFWKCMQISTHFHILTYFQKTCNVKYNCHIESNQLGLCHGAFISKMCFTVFPCVSF